MTKKSKSRSTKKSKSSTKDPVTKLKEELKLYRMLSDQAADAICTVDMKGTLTYANKAQAKLLKVPISKINGTHFRKYLDAVSLPKAYKFFKMTKNGQEVHDELNVVDSQGHVIPVEFHSTPIKVNGKITGVHTIVRDIRKRKQFEQLQRESEKMRAMNHFVSGTAQEIKYPLEGIMKRLQDISSSYKNRDFEYIGYKEFKHIMETIDNVASQVRYCHDTTGRLINLHRKTLKVRRKKCDANEVIKKSTKLIDEQFLHVNTTIKLRLAARLPWVAISDDELGQIIVNLLTNAVQAMPAGGVVTITTAYDKNKKRVCINLKDQGIGVKKENLAQIFEPFFTTKQRGLEKSSGLGLSIVYSIIQAHNGHISVVSNLRHGTLVKLKLPTTKR